MYSGLAYLHRFPEDEVPHLWFILSEPNDPLLAVCLSLTSNHPAGEQLIVIPANTILTDGTRSKAPFVTSHNSAVFISSPKLMSAASLASAFTDDNCRGPIKPNWLRAVRRAVKDGLKFVRNRHTRTDIELIASTWDLGE